MWIQFAMNIHKYQGYSWGWAYKGITAGGRKSNFSFWSGDDSHVVKDQNISRTPGWIGKQWRKLYIRISFHVCMMTFSFCEINETRFQKIATKVPNKPINWEIVKLNCLVSLYKHLVWTFFFFFFATLKIFQSKDAKLLIIDLIMRCT